MLVIEAMMGLFDGAADGSGSAGDLAGLLGLPVILVIDCASMSHSVAALAQGLPIFTPMCWFRASFSTMWQAPA
jgi:cobyrinic acid a,c-diamide synthase